MLRLFYHIFCFIYFHWVLHNTSIDVLTDILFWYKIIKTNSRWLKFHRYIFIVMLSTGDAMINYICFFWYFFVLFNFLLHSFVSEKHVEKVDRTDCMLLFAVYSF